MNASTAAVDAARDDREMIEGLRQRDRQTTLAVLDRYDSSMVRLAMSYGHVRAAAEQIVTETWSEIYTKLRDFDGSTPLKPWLFRHVARRAAADAPAGVVTTREPPAVDPRRFYGRQTRWPGHWREREGVLPVPWSELAPHVDDDAKAAYIQSALERLPSVVRQVAILRDAEGWSAEDVRLALDVAEDDQRDLLARARRAIRADLELRLKDASR
jgi:DNA-directed RNA polymerase specialized sigma24 family protein